MNTTTAQPRLGQNVYIAPTAYVGGDVEIGDGCTIMHHVVVRGDIAPIRIGCAVNLQDGSVVHTPEGLPLDIADHVGIGHRAIIHGGRIGSRTLIGMGAILLDECEIGSECIIAAGAVVAPRAIIPDRSIVMGVPGLIVRNTTDRDLEVIDHVVASYAALGPLHKSGRFPNIAPSLNLPGDSASGPADC